MTSFSGNLDAMSLFPDTFGIAWQHSEACSSLSSTPQASESTDPDEDACSTSSSSSALGPWQQRMCCYSLPHQSGDAAGSDARRTSCGMQQLLNDLVEGSCILQGHLSVSAAGPAAEASNLSSMGHRQVTPAWCDSMCDSQARQHQQSSSAAAKVSHWLASDEDCSNQKWFQGPAVIQHVSIGNNGCSLCWQEVVTAAAAGPSTPGECPSSPRICCPSNSNNARLQLEDWLADMESNMAHRAAVAATAATGPAAQLVQTLPPPAFVMMGLI